MLVMASNSKQVVNRVILAQFRLNVVWSFPHLFFTEHL
jgi:hypothetical protein